MYIRIKSRRVPSEFIQTANEWIMAPDGSGILVNGTLDGATLKALPLEVRKNAIHIVPNARLGVAGVQIATKDDGVIVPSVRLHKSAQDVVEELDWHFKIMFLPVNIPWAD